MQEPFDNIVQHLFHQPSLHSVTVDELENMATQHPYFAAAHLLLLKKMQDIEHPRFNTQLHKTTLYFNNPLWLQYLLQPELAATEYTGIQEHVREFSTTAATTIEPVVEHATEPRDVLPHAGIMDVISSVFEEPDAPAQQPVSEGMAAIATDETSLTLPVIDETIGTENISAAPEGATTNEVPPAEDAPLPVLEEYVQQPHHPETEALLQDEPVYVQQEEMPQDNSAYTIPVEDAVMTEAMQEENITEDNNAAVSVAAPAAHAQQERLHTEHAANMETAIPVEAPVLAETIHAQIVTEDNAATSLDESTTHEQQEAFNAPRETNIEPAIPPATPAAAETTDEPVITENNLVNTTVEPDGPDNTAEIPAATAGSHDKPLFKTVIETAAAKNDFLFEPYHTVDYFASQGIKLSKMEADSKDRLGRQLKSFTEWLKTMKKLPQVSIDKILSENEESKVVADAIHSIENKEVITEAMAEVFEKQGMVDKAVEVYQKLSLLNPAKSAYFAAKIAILKH